MIVRFGKTPIGIINSLSEKDIEAIDRYKSSNYSQPKVGLYWLLLNNRNLILKSS